MMHNMMYKTTSLEYSGILDDYGVALKMTDLQHLVLFEKLAVDTALTVNKYLQWISYKGAPIFSLRIRDQTFDLARRVSQQSSDIKQAWQNEQAAANTRREERWREARWQEVLRKKQKVKDLLSELCDVNGRLASTRSTNSTLFAPSRHTCKSDDLAYRVGQELISAIESRILSIETSLKYAMQPPPNLLQPLPENNLKATPIFFPLRMPRNFQMLSKLSAALKCSCPAKTPSYMPTWVLITILLLNWKSLARLPKSDGINSIQSTDECVLPLPRVSRLDPTNHFRLQISVLNMLWIICRAQMVFGILIAFAPAYGGAVMDLNQAFDLHMGNSIHLPK